MLYDTNVVISEIESISYKNMTPTEKLIYLNKLKEKLEEERDKVLKETTGKFQNIIKK